ncbi:hypothetical protein C4553_03215 [Candidatus Parcubacteria bacterium]|nr:MAG: hypothetical protein C4553_03215 [Candidatus Parcubacteria bacterium]
MFGENFSIPIQKIASALLITAVIATSFAFVLIPKPVEASVLAYEINPALVIHDIMDNVKELGLDAIAWSIAGVIMQTMSAQVLNWVQTGRTPTFINDWQTYFTNIGNLASREFVGTYFTQGILPQVDPSYRNLLQAYVQNPFNPVDIDLDTVIQSSLGSLGINQGTLSNYSRSFQAGGGWKTFNALMQPNNNFYSTYLSTIGAQRASVAVAASANKERAQAGQGFLEKLNPLNWTTDTPSGTVRDTVKKNIVDALPDKIQQADEIAEILIAILMSVFNRLLTQGLN